MTVESFGVWIRDRLNARDARRLSHNTPLPATVEKAYWHDTEFARDSTRLAALGYEVASEVENEPYVSATLPADTGGVMGHLSRTVRRRVPSIHVIYQHGATPSGAVLVAPKPHVRW
ncbi:MAG: hypothetical protein WCB51_13645 [Candidatus Dormiibacterota bacterium]